MSRYIVGDRQNVWGDARGVCGGGLGIGIGVSVEGATTVCIYGFQEGRVSGVRVSGCVPDTPRVKMNSRGNKILTLLYTN